MLSIKSLILLFLITTIGSSDDGILNTEQFDEHLIVKTLPNGQLSAHFQFKTFVYKNHWPPFGVNSGRHNDLFPFTLLRLFHHLDIQELHFSLTKGFWKAKRWGLPARDTIPNAHIWAWFSSYKNSTQNWNKLISLLSGQFCASINLINPTVTICPRLSYEPFLLTDYIKDNLQFKDRVYGYMAALPQEAICTENLTPFTKMLPCQRTKGLATLLQAINIFDSQFFSMSLDFAFACSNLENCISTTGIELKQNIQIIFNAPLILDGKYSWTLNSLFGQSLENHCPLATKSLIHVDVTTLVTNQAEAKLTLPASKFVKIDHQQISMNISNQIQQSQWKDSQRIYAEYDLKKIFQEQKQSPINIGIQYSNSYDGNQLPYPVDFGHLEVRRHSHGIGVQTGGISVLLTNRFDFDVDAIYVDSIPWYLRMYFHTIRIETRSLDDKTSKSSITNIKQMASSTFYYEPARDRTRPHQLEIKLHLPRKSLTEIRFDFDHQFLRWTEFPPDPNHGLYINPATVTFLFEKHSISAIYERFLPQILSNESEFSEAKLSLLSNRIPLRLYTEPLIIQMPTPDFSMPYNVICLVSTALTIAFGPICDLTASITRLSTKKQPSTQQTDDNERKRRFIFF